MISQLIKKAEFWLDNLEDKSDQRKIKSLINKPEELEDSFYRNLDFGTGGMRGVMGIGSNRINKYTVSRACLGIVAFLSRNLNLKKKERPCIAIAYDSRNKSDFFAKLAAKVFNLNNIEVEIFEELKPTPMLSFLVIKKKCDLGLVFTASHNPKEYNGLKVFDKSGNQITSPKDTILINIINQISFLQVFEFLKKFNFQFKQSLDRKFNNLTTPGLVTNEKSAKISISNIDQDFFTKIGELKYSFSKNKSSKQLKIVYTGLHGTGVKVIPKALKYFGFNNILTTKEQDLISGDFPTVISPNPEEPEALNLAIKLAKKNNVDLVFGTDPDSDRVGVAVKEDNEEGYLLLNGNQTGALILNYLLLNLKDQNRLDANNYIIKSVVTSDLLKEMASTYDIKTHETLTGFKYMANVILENKNKNKFLFAAEESYGYLMGNYVLDKDAVTASVIISEMYAWLNENKTSIIKFLHQIYLNYGVFYEDMMSFVKKGKKGKQEIKNLMKGFRTKFPGKILNKKISEKRDYLSYKGFPKTDMLQFLTEEGLKVSIRPSGTEPKIKFYFSICKKIKSYGEIKETFQDLKFKVNKVKKELIYFMK